MLNEKEFVFFSDVTISFIKKSCNIAHSAISNTNLGKSLYFNVIDINEYPWIKYPYY